ncbi:hypothetical protein OEZ85_008349 [Tetradesmus obliquus]|uniref:Fumarylacetoacetase n=1 Tax=Tetradesmus obliquus TaxID=3088 RepID=A0ABY8TIL3_TETOB|nr:hypothetical protein OEZ85_008349 [Tetradesmus obliquus]
MESFVAVFNGSDFPLNNLPFGACKFKSDVDRKTRLCVAIGEHVVDLGQLQAAGCFTGPILSQTDCFTKATLNGFMGLGKPAWQEARSTLTRLLSSGEGLLRDNVALREAAIVPQSEVEMQLPAAVGDYTDFYTSKHHAFNCGSMFRDPAAALAPNWLHLPVGYHGRCSSIVPSGRGVRRPWGQMLPLSASSPVEGPCQAVDFELEMACIMGSGNELGSPVSADEASSAIFGLLLLNDWSARDIQKWEMAPLGPFNGKNWATQVSPWIVTLDALEPFRCEAAAQDPPVLPYLQESSRHTWDVALSASITPAGAAVETTVTRTNLKHLYWTFQQMVAHHTAGGCNLNPGDLLGSGTVSGPEDTERGCLLELTWGGKQKVALAGGPDGGVMERVYLADGDEVVFRARCEGGAGGVPGIGFGECRGKLLPCGYSKR